ncbi:MAG: zinc-ribbon domain-containing protein [Methanobrevibacter thaueri]|uniref:Zinc-ribbon domain-containing protein n=1 Tax=Methanobrevibacter thaueri TaxID=190975 RepID=A0A8T3VAR0_9EURY|nr:zinc ribbon domain-containing protein [Methanobrevibacter thaueri]MBE6501047.1 zinc-ribbon domain-containing protein [Methanobrevibacter thaueri]
MRCPNCDSENNDSAKFCKKCGTPLKKELSHENMINSMNNKSGKDDTTKYLIVALAIVAIVLAGAFVYIYGFGSHQSNDSQPQQIQSADDDSEPVQAESSSSSQASQASKSTPKTTSMSIRGGSFTTGGELEDKTYASIDVGSQHAGEKVILQIFYSRDGSTLNNGNMVPVTVDSSGHLEVSSADAYKYFPDFAEINLYDESGSKLLDTKSVSLSPEAGTQTF